MLPRKMFENFHTVVAIVVLFEQFVGKFCLKFLPLNKSKCFTKRDAFCSYIFDYMRAEGVRPIVIEMGSKLWKIAFMKNMFESRWWGDASPTSTLDPPLLLL